MKQAGRNSLFFLMRIALRACASIICGQASMCVYVRERELVTLSSLVRVACITCLRFSLSLSPSYSLHSRVFFFLDPKKATNTQKKKNSFFFYCRHKWVSTLPLSSSSPEFFFCYFSFCLCRLCHSFFFVSLLVHYYYKM